MLLISNLDCNDLVVNKEILLELLIDTYEINFQKTREQCKCICEEKLESMNNYVKQGSAIILGAIIDNELVGFLWLYKHDYWGEPRLHINQIAVRIRYRGKGIGKSLIEEAEKQAKYLDVHTIDLFVSENNMQALVMYDKLGFKTERRYLKKNLLEK